MWKEIRKRQKGREDKREGRTVRGRDRERVRERQAEIERKIAEYRSQREECERRIEEYAREQLALRIVELDTSSLENNFYCKEYLFKANFN